VKLEDGNVTFRWKDYADGSRRKLMTLDAVEFLRRFLVHVLPRSFVRIRHCGILANRVRAQSLARCRELLRATPPATAAMPSDEPAPCEVCGKGIMVVVERIEKASLAAMLAASAVPFDDTS
jgi:hypothetical protein